MVGSAAADRRAPAAELAALASGDVDAAAQAAGALAAYPDARPALRAVLVDGAPGPLAIAVAGALATKPIAAQATSDTAALAPYAHHRKPDVRAAAIGALAKLGDATAHVVIIAALRDPVASVRAAAGAAAAKNKIAAAIDPLFARLAHGDDAAVHALAALADRALAARIANLREAPEASRAACLGEILARPDFDPDPARVEVIQALAQLRDGAAWSALADYASAAPKNRPSRKAAEQAVQAHGRQGGQ